MCGKHVPCCLRMVHQSGRVFRTILYGWRRREKSVPLACRQTGVFRHGWISHTQDDIVHSSALNVLRERDRIFGGLGLHPLLGRWSCPWTTYRALGSRAAGLIPILGRISAQPPIGHDCCGISCFQHIPVASVTDVDVKTGGRRHARRVSPDTPAARPSPRRSAAAAGCGSWRRGTRGRER